MLYALPYALWQYDFRQANPVPLPCKKETLQAFAKNMDALAAEHIPYATAVHLARQNILKAEGTVQAAPWEWLCLQ